MIDTQTRGSIPLRFDYWGVVGAGFTGLLPSAVWWLSLALPFGALDGTPSSSGWAIVGALVAIFAFVAPILIPCWVLHARQPQGAHIEWDETSVSEWDGPSRRAAIPWAGIAVGYQRWAIRAGGRLLSTPEAIQLAGGTDVITAWVNDPGGAPVLRRRIYARPADIKALVEAVEQHSPDFERQRRRALEHFEAQCVIGSPDWSRAADPERSRPRSTVLLGRFGYVCAIVAPLSVGPSPPVGFALMALGAGLLALRARPAFRELRALNRGLTETTATPALAIRRRAVLAEAFVRAAAVVLVLVSTWIWRVWEPGR